MTPDLTIYKTLIQHLATIVNRSDFNSEFDDRTQKLSADTRFLVKMEIKRLAKPCIRSIDLRTKVKDECRLYNYQGIDHYLHINGILHFEKLVKRYGQYCFGVYEGVLEFAQQEKKRYTLQEALPSSPYNEIAEPEQQYITPCQELLNYPIRCEERLNYVSQIEVFFNDNTSVHAATSDISMHGLRIRLKDPSNLHLFKAFEPITIIFRSVDRAVGISRSPIAYHVLGVSGEGNRTSVHLRRDKSFDHPKFAEFIDTLFKLHKRRYKVNLDNVEMAVGTKIYEQSFVNNTPSLPVFVTRDHDDQYAAAYASVNTCGKRILDYWSDEQKTPVIGYLLNPERIKTLVNDNGTNPSLVVYCFHHILDEKIYFYSASERELAAEPELADTFLSYGSRKVSWRVFHLACSDVYPNQGILPTSIPDGVTKEVDRINHAPSPKLRGLLGEVSNMISITDITSESGQECYQRRTLDKERIKDLKVFGHARNKKPHKIEALRHKLSELRRQTRYVLRTPVIVKGPSHNIKGFTEDISVSGLKLELEEPFTHRQNSKVHVSFSRLNEITDNFDLNNLQYRVKHINYDKHVLHLKAVSDDETSEAEQFFSELISNNTDKLPALDYKENVPGISKALRAIHAKSTTQFCAHVEKKQQGYLPAMATMNPIRAEWLKLLYNCDNLATVDLSWLYQDKDLSQPFVKQSLKTLRIDPKPISTEIFIAYRSSDFSRVSPITAKWDYQLASHYAKKTFIEQAEKQGEFFAFNVIINKALKPDLECLEHELLYLGQHAIHKATHFEERMWDIAGCIFLTDISEEFKFRYLE